jgi:hypothetical protein
MVFFSFTVNSQNLTPNKYSKEIQRIVNTYDQDELKSLYTEAAAKDALNLAQVRSYALLNNIQTRYETEDGTLYELQFITDDGTPIYYRTYNANAAISTRANFLNTGGGLGLDLNGDDMVGHIWDGGLARSTHQEYDGAGGSNRYSIGDGSSTLNYHSAHVAGTIMASGFQAAAKGMAWQADAVGYDWNSDTSEAAAAASSGMINSNHSYGYVASGIPDAWFGQYGQDARDWDGIMYNAPYYLMMVAAGNDGQDNTSNGAPLDGLAAYDKLSGHATAKNNLVVANGQDATIDVDGNLISALRNAGSSEGPTDDYRIKPDIMGNGTSLYSSFETADNAYGNLTGTSMASPNVAGSLILLQEHYFNLNAGFMRAATLKGLALHTADDIAPTGPDAQTGWGLMNSKKAAETLTTAAAASGSAIVEEITLLQGQSYQIMVQANGVDPLMASISWTDPAGALNNGTNSNTPALVNDLDIRLDNGTNYAPWRLTSVTTNGAGDNIVDPYERIDISGASGMYTLTVTHKGSLSSGSQDFSLIVTGIVVASTPVISYASTTGSVNELSDCNFTDILVPLNIGQAPSADAYVNFTVAGGTATSGLDFDILTPSITFPMGSTASQDLGIRIYHDGFVETGGETAIIDFTVDNNGGDASADTNADSFLLTINDDDFAAVDVITMSLLTEDFEANAWASIDGDGDGNDWLGLTGLTYPGITGSFPGSETNLTVLGGTGKANANNYLISPQMVISPDATSVDFTFGVGGYLTQEHYAIYWATNVSSAASINAGLQLDETDSPSNTGILRTISTSAIAGQTGYFVIRHFNSIANDGILLFDNASFDVNVTTLVQTAVNTGSSDQILLTGAGTVYTSDAVSGDVMLDVTNNNADDYGCIDVSVSRAGLGAQSYNGSTSPNLVMDKTFDVNAVNIIGSGSTSITFYFTEAEIAGWETAIGGTVGVSRNLLVAARENGGGVVETSVLTIGSFGSNVTLTGSFTGLEDTFYFGPAAAFVISCPGLVKTWNGSSWSPIGDPDSTNRVFIAGAYNTLTNGDIDCCELTILSGNTLTVAGLTYANVNGNITVDNTAALIVEHTGNVVQVDDTALVVNNGSINVNLTTPALNARDFMIMGSPMTAETNAMFSAHQVLNHTTANFTPYVGVPPVVGVNFHDQDSNDWSNFASTFNAGEGYLVRPSMTSGGTYNYTYNSGTLNNGVITYSAFFGDDKEDSPNVLSNPYASAIDADLLISSNAIIDELYFWEHLTTPAPGIPGPLTANFSMEDISTRNYLMGVAAANGGGIPNGVISTGQGFGIKANAAGDVTFNNALRLTSGNTTFRRPVDKDLIWITVREPQYHMGSTAGIGFTENATPAMDQGYDTMKLGTVVSLYSHLEDGSELLGIQGREPFDTSITIPMGFSTLIDVDGGLPYTISIANLEGNNIENATVYLVDHLLNITTNLSEGNYEFVSEAGTFDNRFTLQFEEGVILGSSENELERITVYPIPTKNMLHISSPGMTVQSATIYDIRGRKVNEVQFTPEKNYQIDMSLLDASIYFIKITSESGSITKRIIKQ